MSSPFKVDLEWWGPGTIPPPASIVWCNFPFEENPDQPGPKARPALVFKVRYYADPPDGRHLVLVAYGTSKLKTGERRHDFTLANSAQLDLLRLPQATRFDLDRMLWLPWARPFFVPRRNSDQFSTPTISTLPDNMQQLLRWTMARREDAGLNGHYHQVSKGPVGGQ